MVDQNPSRSGLDASRRENGMARCGLRHPLLIGDQLLLERDANAAVDRVAHGSPAALTNESRLGAIHFMDVVAVDAGEGLAPTNAVGAMLLEVALRFPGETHGPYSRTVAFTHALPAAPTVACHW